VEQSAREEARPRSRAEIIDLLRTDGDRLAAWVEGLPDTLLAEQVRMPGGGSMTRFEMLVDIREHQLHHGAQLTVLQRLIGIVPHSTRDRAARAELAAASAA
jgi:uncharacterized damage-inducible protein DinB